MEQDYPLPSEDGLGRIRSWTAESRMLQWLNFEADLQGTEFLYRLGFAEHHIGNVLIRALHGGVVSSFLQACATAELKGRLDGDVKLKVVSVHCDFLRPARDKDMLAEARIIQMGRRVAFLEATGWHVNAATPVGKANIAVRLL